MKKTIIIASAAALAAPHAHAVLGVGDIVSDPIVEQATVQKNIFDQIKYAWEQVQWAEKLATLHNTLTTVREHLETANMVKQAIGDPVAAIGLIDNGLFSGYLQESGITDTLSCHLSLSLPRFSPSPGTDREAATTSTRTTNGTSSWSALNPNSPPTTTNEPPQNLHRTFPETGRKTRSLPCCWRIDLRWTPEFGPGNKV